MLAHLGAMLAHLGAMVAHLEPQDPKKGEKKWMVGGRGCSPLSYGEERTAVQQGHGQGAPGRISALTRDSRPGAHYVGLSCGYVCLCWPHVEPC